MRTCRLFVFLILLVSSSCEKETGDFVWYQYDQTGCADKWEANANSTDQELTNAVIIYLNEQSISFKRINVGYDSSLAESCKSCFCRTGKFILVSASIDNETKLSEIGFRKLEKEN
jgi:hypothetical protein